MMKEVLERKRAQLGADHFETLESMVLLARFHESRGEANEAIALLEEVLAATERDAALGLGTDEARLSRLAARAGDNYHGTGYATLARLLVSRNPKRGLEVAELAKARTLGEALGTSVREARLPRERQEELRAIRRELARAEDRLYEAAPGSAAQLTQLAERARLKAKLAAKLPPPRASPGMPLSAIPEGAVFLSYLVSTDGIIVFAARRDGSVRAFDLGSAAGLAASVDAWRRMQASADPASERIWRVSPGHFAFSISQPGADATRARSVDEVTQALSRRALAPIESAIGTARQVIVSPDGPLAFLPFDALLFKGRALLYSTRVSHVPSLATLSFLTARVTGIAEQRGRKEFLGIAIASHEGGSAATRWSALPSAEIEAREIAATFGAGRSRLLLGAAATEAALSALDASGELKHYRYVHVATHAFLSGRDPRLSAVVLADGSVSAARWSAFRFRSDLVVLSACETGLGEVRTAEGVLGLPYAMMASGSRAALLSVWRVADEGARQFMGRFYARLRKGVDPSAALRETKLEFARSKGPWSAPRHWAPYVLYGAS
jgi:CHAT domain-containing protein